MARRKVSEEQLQAFSSAFRQDRSENVISAKALSDRMDARWRKSGSTLRNYENGVIAPENPYVVLAIERALKVRPRGKYLRLLGMDVPKTDAPSVTRPSPDELVEGRLAAVEAQLAELHGDVQAVLQAVADRVALPESLLRSGQDGPAGR